MVRLAILFLFCFQSTSEWELLSDVEIVKGFDEFMGTEIEAPKFSERLKSREGSKVTLEGYIIPLKSEASQDYFILSRFPYQSCFFCGQAGPETVVEVYSDHKFAYTDERVRVKGKLKLNPDNPMRLFYILEDCEVVKLD